MTLRRWLFVSATVVAHGSAAVVLAAAVGLAAVSDVPALRISGTGLTRIVAPGPAAAPSAAEGLHRVEDTHEQAPAVAADPPPAPQPGGSAVDVGAPARQPAAKGAAPQGAHEGPAAAPAAQPSVASPPKAAAADPVVPAPASPVQDASPAKDAPAPAPPAKTTALAPAAPAAAPQANDAPQKAVVPPIQRVAPGKAHPAAAVVAAKELFGKAATPAPLAARSIGAYAKGCLAGAEPLAVDGPAWQAMRLSRNRNWGHPDLIRLVERFAGEVKAHDGWSGLLVGDISQPRGGPMLTGHASHQIGLDADIWLTPMPERRLTSKEREELAATSMLAADRISVDPKVWTASHVRIIKRAASYPEVERVLVHPAIKQALCASVGRGPEDQWLLKVRPIWGHYFHMHVRISCPKDSPGCTHQAVPPGNLEHACTKEVATWIALVKRSLAPPPPPRPGTPPPSKAPAAHPVTLDHLPPECRVVLESDVARGNQATAGKQ